MIIVYFAALHGIYQNWIITNYSKLQSGCNGVAMLRQGTLAWKNVLGHADYLVVSAVRLFWLLLVFYETLVLSCYM